MKILIMTNNPVTLNYAQAILKDADIESFIFDANVSIMDGSIGAIPQRLMVVDESYLAAIQALEALDMGHEIYRDN